jgi:hypothetical protein
LRDLTKSLNAKTLGRKVAKEDYFASLRPGVFALRVLMIIERRLVFSELHRASW